MTAPRVIRILLIGTFLTSTAGTAWALDGDDFAAALNAAYASSGGKIVFSGSEVDGDTVTLRDAALQVAGSPDLPAGDITFEGVEEGGDGGYTAERLTLPNVDYKEDGKAFTIADIEIDGIEIPGSSSGDGKAPILFYHSASTGPIKLTGPKGDLVSASGMTSNVDRTDGDNGYASDFSIDGVTVHLDQATKPKARAAIKAMGYETITGSMTGSGTWERDSGRLSLSDLSLAFDDVGTLDINFELSGYTVEFLDQLNTLREEAANGSNDQSQRAMGLGMLGLMQELNFISASVSFTDDSVTSKVLDYVGQQQGVSGDQMAAAAKGMLPLALGKLNNPEFQQEITDAVGTFLDDPQKLTVSAAPDDAVALPMIAASVMASPQRLPDVLGVTVTANE